MTPFRLLFVLLPVLVARALFAAEAPVRELRVLTYDTLSSEQGLGPVLFGGFERKCGCRVRVRSVGDAGQMVSRLQLEREGKVDATDVLVGIDQTLWPEVRPFAVDFKLSARFDPRIGPLEAGFVPLDWGVMAFMTSLDSGSPAGRPSSWRHLLRPEFRRRILLQDPRTSTPGIGWVWGAEAALGREAAAGFFSALRRQWLTLTPGWSGAYALFLKGEAPLVWSYTTSQAYHRRPGAPVTESRYHTLVFEEGNPIQVEGVVSVRKSELIRQFLEFLLSPEVQREIPRRQWMFPSVAGVGLPPEFKDVPSPKKLLRWDSKVRPREIIERWEGGIRQ